MALLTCVNQVFNNLNLYQMTRKYFRLFMMACALAGFAACNSNSNNQSSNITIETSLDSSKFDSLIDNRQVKLYQIKNNNGVSASLTNYGARIISLLVPNQDGKLTDVVVGLGSIKEYKETADPYFGATIGRYGNRIANGKFSIDGLTYQSTQNNGTNMLHGGVKGFHDVVWDATKLNDSTLQFNYLSKNGEMGFPGNLQVKVIYQLTTDNALKISYEATTDKTTITNLTNHAFFNLNGEGSGDVLDHQMQIFANQFTPVDSLLIPTGVLAQVENTPFDFRTSETIGKRIETKEEQLIFGKGYDHNYVLSGTGSQIHAAKVIGEKSGIVMDVYTDQPGIQFYSGNFMKGANTFKGGSKDEFRTAFCLETQHFPDSPNQPNFPSTLLKKGETLKSESSYQFSVKK